MMKVRLISISSKWEYAKVKAVTFADYSNLILPSHLNFSDIIKTGKIYLLLSDKSILTFFNSTGTIVLKDDFLKISCPKIYTSKEEFSKIKLQESLFNAYQEISDYEKKNFEEVNWIEEDENLFRSV